MRPRFLADADFSQKIVLGLLRREPAIDFRTALQGGVLGRPDPEVLALAARENRILISHDRATMPTRFARFTASQSSPGLILVSQEIDMGTAIEDLLLIWAAPSLEEWRDRMGFVPL
jgi:hypothetical protein